MAAILAGCAAAPAPVAVSDAANGGAVRLAAGQQLVLRLAANASTGYSWAVTDAAGLRQVSAAYTPGGNLPGSGGTEQFVFAPNGPGSGLLVLIYRRPWEPDDPSIRRFSLKVSVAPG